MGAAATGGTNPHILVIDDEPDLRSALVLLLEPDYRVTAAATPRQALALCEAQRFDLALLDVRLPEMSGLELLPRLHQLDPRMGVILMTVRGNVSEAVLALRDLGAMDYIEKPFEIEDLTDRVERALGHLVRDPLITLGDLVLDPRARCVRRRGERLLLSRQEFDLLLYLIRHEGRPVSWQELARELWQCDVSCATSEIVRCAIRRLRRKLGDTGTEPRYIWTLRGVGYQAAEQARQTDTKVTRF
jgi:DNA-binding response OmpR family regulator